MDETKYIHLGSRDELYKVDASKIVYFKANGNYTDFVLCNEVKGTVLMNLSQVHEMLNKELKEQTSIFERVGREFIVNLNYVFRIEVVRKRLTLSDGERFSYSLQSVSKEALKKLKEKYSHSGLKHIANASEEELTQLSVEDTSHNPALGRLVVVKTNTHFQLKIGKNIIGRMAAGSAAHVQIPCDSKLISRDHLVVEIENEPGKGLVHYISLNKKQVNPTYIGKVKLEYGDKVLLNHNDIIKLPDVELRFEIPDEEGTELNVK